MTTPGTDLQQKSRLDEIQVSRTTGAQIATMADAWTLAVAYHRAGMAPRGMQKPEQVMIALMAGAEVGLGANASLKHLMVVNNVASLYGDGPMALCLRSGFVKTHRSGYDGKPYDDTYTAWFEVERRDIEGVTRREFSVADAKKAGLWGKSGPWTNHPKRMLFVRARAFALRDSFPDVLGGLGIAEELEETDDGNEGHASRSDAMLAALREAKGSTPDEADDVIDVESSDLPPEPDEDEAEAIRRAEAAEAGLFDEGSE